MSSNAVILVADDNRDDVCLLRYAFREAGIQNRLEAVSDGSQAIDYLLGRGRYADRERYPAPDFMLLDLRLPRVDGYEVLEWLQHQNQLRQLPVVILSGPESREQVDRALDLGAVAYYQKPLGLRDLVELVRNEFSFLFQRMQVAA